MWKFSKKFICVFALACALCSLGTIVVSANKIVETPLPPNTAESHTPALDVATVPTSSSVPVQSKYPVRLVIPSIKLDTRVINVGLNEKGEMDVPNGKTKDVGWYKDGIIPGNTGAAVIDAHVFAAFSNLRYLKVGSDVYVITAQNKKLHFVVTESTVFKLHEL